MRINDFRLKAGLTWKEMAEPLEISVSQLMMAKSGSRNLSKKVMRRFGELEGLPTIPMETEGFDAIKQQLVLEMETVINEKIDQFRTNLHDELALKINGLKLRGKS